LTVFVLQLGQVSSSVVALHRGHDMNLAVGSPQTSHRSDILLSLHFGQKRLTTSIFTLPALAAEKTSLMEPPSYPTGNRVWTGGFILLTIAFSGLPTLTPMVVVL
jgi:hypothetical protein